MSRGSGPVDSIESGPAARRHRRGGPREAPRDPEPHLVRHGGHHGQDLPHRERGAAAHERVRGRRRAQHRSPPASRGRLPPSRGRDRPRRDRRGGREHRVDRSRRRASRGAAERGRRSGARLLRPGRAATDGDRCERRAPAISIRGHLVGGELGIDADLAREALTNEIARPLGLRLEEAAHGVHTVVNSTMVRAVRAVSSEIGRDPSEFVLFAFGGSGPVHSALLARQGERAAPSSFPPHRASSAPSACSCPPSSTSTSRRSGAISRAPTRPSSKATFAGSRPRRARCCTGRASTTHRSRSGGWWTSGTPGQTSGNHGRGAGSRDHRGHAPFAVGRVSARSTRTPTATAPRKARRSRS